LPGDPLIRLASLNQQAWVLGWGGKYRQALETAERALREADATGIDFVVCHALVAKATALIGLRKFAAAQQTITEIADRQEKEPDGWTEANAAIASAKLCVSLGDLDRAAHHLTFDPGVRQCVSLRAEYDGYRGLIAAAQGSTDEATKWLERCASWSTHVEAFAIGAMGRAILSTSAGEDEASAIEHFATAMGTGFRDVIVIGCRAQPRLARLVVQDGTYRDALKTAFIESADTAIARAVGLLIPRIPTRGESLSPRELEVYELMVQGRTNREIAQTLFVTESTTKVHVRHIFEKLGVRSRVEAVRAWQTTTTRHKADAT